MALHVIKKGRHQDNRPFSSWPHFGRTSISRNVTFHESCRYELPAYNALDVNKLFGLSFGFFALHQNSPRFGFYYDPADDTVVLVAYCYINGVRNHNEQFRFPEVARVKIGQEVRCEIELGYRWNGPDTPEIPQYIFCVEDESHILGMVGITRPAELPKYGLTHSLFFGGVLPAPHDMHIEMAKEK